MGEIAERSDESLMQEIASGDTDALKALFFRYAPLMLAMGQRMLGQGGDAEDVLNDVFYETWSKGGRYDPARGSVRAYLLLLMRSRCLDRLRARKARPDLHAPLDSHLNYPGHEPGPVQRIQDDESRELVRRALADLDVDQRIALELSFYEGLSHREIADRLDQPVGTIKGRLRSGLIKLRHSLRIKGGD